MRRLSELAFPVILLGLASVVMLLPAGHAVVERQFAVGRAFLYSALLLAILTAFLALATANRKPRLSARNHLSVLVGSYAILPLALALPVVQAVPGVTFWQAWFEMLSAFTTTGATLFEPDDLSGTLHLWRALIGWLGGFFVIVMAVAVLAPLNLGGAEVATGRLPGARLGGMTQITRIADSGERIGYYALMLFPAYGGLTLVLWVGLLLAGDNGLVALCHAMATLSTSGISPLGGLETAASGRLGEALIAVLLLVALSRKVLGAFARVERRFWSYDPEFHTAGAILLAVVVTVCITQVPGNGQAIGLIDTFRMIWGTLFTCLSFLTTTGFVSQDWTAGQAWTGQQTPGLVLLALALIGGGAATTSGGVKLLRVYALFRHGQRELERLIEPSSVGGRGQTARQLRNEGAHLAWVFFVLFAMSIGSVTALLTLFGVDLEAAIILAVAALTTTGPLAETGLSSAEVWASLDTGPQSVLAAAMVLGRLETLAVLAFLVPDAWRR